MVSIDIKFRNSFKRANCRLGASIAIIIASSGGMLLPMLELLHRLYRRTYPFEIAAEALRIARTMLIAESSDRQSHLSAAANRCLRSTPQAYT